MQKSNIAFGDTIDIRCHKNKTLSKFVYSQEWQIVQDKDIHDAIASDYYVLINPFMETSQALEPCADCTCKFKERFHFIHGKLII